MTEQIFKMLEQKKTNYWFNYLSFQNINLVENEADFPQLVGGNLGHFGKNINLLWLLRYYLNSLVCNLQRANSVAELNLEKGLNYSTTKVPLWISKRCFPKRTRDLKSYLKCKLLIYVKWIVLKYGVNLSTGHYFWFPILSYAKTNSQRQIQIYILKSIYLVWIN